MSAGTSTAPGPYCELHAHSCFSLLDGVPFPEELAEAAAARGLPALALTDHDAIYGAVPFFARAREVGLKPLLGAEMTLADGAHLTLLAEDQGGYQNLCRLITLARAEQPKGQAALPWPALAAHTAGLVCLTGCRRGPVAAPWLAGQPARAAQALDRLLEIFGPRSLYIEVQRHLQRADVRLGRALAALAHARGLPVVATGNVHYLAPEDASLHDALISVRERAPLPQAGPHLRPNHEFYLRGSTAMAALFADFPAALANTLAVAERCNVALPSGLQTLPAYPLPAGLTALGYLRQLCEAELPRLYSGVRSAERQRISADRAPENMLNKELAMIEKLGLANYFLIVWDIVNFCRRRGILCHGRGSAANSLVAHLLDISAVDPIAQGLVVERFLSVEHGGTPDIDLDIDAARRETVIQYVYDRWGRDHAAMACTYITYRSASALRDAGYALGFKPEAIEAVESALEARRRQPIPGPDGRAEPPDVSLAAIAEQLADPGLPATDSLLQALAPHPSPALHVSRLMPHAFRHLPPHGGPSSVLRPSSSVGHHPSVVDSAAARLLALAACLQKRPRHLGLHNGGMIITGCPIAELVPVEPATMEDRTVVQFDKDYLERLGIVKVDLLGLRMLSAIADAVAFIQQGRGEAVDLDRLDLRDPAVYDQICSAQTIGLFQVESGAQVSVIPHMQPRCFQDLVIEISLIRPGPLQGNMVRPYLRRRQGLEPVTYLHPALKPALAETLGVIVFQEQVIKLARDFAGFTPGRGEVLRRALGHKHAPDELAKFKDEFIAGALAQGAIQAGGGLSNLGGHRHSEPAAARRAWRGLSAGEESRPSRGADSSAHEPRLGMTSPSRDTDRRFPSAPAERQEGSEQNLFRGPGGIGLAEQVWQMIANFAGYSFSKAHAAAFAVIVYWSAWLRVHYPTEYFCGLLRNAPLGTYPANVLEAEARRVGVKFLPFDINRSLAKATVEPMPTNPHAGAGDEGRKTTLAEPRLSVVGRRHAPFGGRSSAVALPSSFVGRPSSAVAIRFGLDYVHGLGEDRAEALVQARGDRPFTSLADCVARTCVPAVGLDRRALENLVLAGAFDSFGERRQLLWDLAEAFDLARRPAPQLALDLPDERAALAPMPPDLKLMRTFAVTGVTAGPHLVELRRDAFARAGCLPYRELQKLRSGVKVRAGGLVADGLRRPPTAKGTSFIRLEDADGLVDVIVPPAVYAECRQALRGVFVVVEGILQRNGPVLSLLARRVESLPG